MFTVYALYSQKHNKIYIGYTSNIVQRLLSHNKLGTKGYTIKYRPWEVVFTEDYKTKEEAILREKNLKSAIGREFVWNKIKNRGLLSA
ncbi:MAG: GIY-YIG nuclease family protein [Vicingus serpentipes]|nr:GIY-YIG nuclease family protein [Vicingus serpentipes]